MLTNENSFAMPAMSRDLGLSMVETGMGGMYGAPYMPYMPVYGLQLAPPLQFDKFAQQKTAQKEKTNNIKAALIAAGVLVGTIAFAALSRGKAKPPKTGGKHPLKTVGKLFAAAGGKIKNTAGQIPQKFKALLGKFKKSGPKP